MNKIVKIGGHLLLVAVLTVSSAFSFSNTVNTETTGIVFFTGTLKEAKAKANKEKKLIFIDCYTTWCGPCKNMSKKTFVDKAVGEYFNKNFICMKIDMEKGEGISLASTYTVEAYPTYLFLNAKGEVKHRDLGFIDAARFIEVGKTALTK